MLRSNLIEAIRTLSQKEMKEFGEFVSSPFFNKNKNVIKLYGIIKKYYPGLESEKLSKENVYAKLFPSEKYKDSSMRLLMFYLYETLEKFLAYSSYIRNELQYKKNLLAEFNERNLLKDFEKTYTQVKEKLDATLTKDEEFYTNSFDIASVYFAFLSKVHSEKYEKYMNGENLESMFSSLTYNYLIRIFKFYTAVLNTHFLLNAKINTDHFENILSNFNPAQFENVPLVNIYYRVIMMLMKPREEEHYFMLKKLVLENEQALGNVDLSNLYINLENYCTRKVRSGNMNFLRENFELYDLEIEKGLYKTNDNMSSAFYVSYVVVGCRLKEYDKVKDFIEKYKSEMRKDSRESLFNFCKAMLETDLKNFEKALEFLSKVKTDELYLKMDVRMLQSRLYYMLDWDDSLNSLLDAFRRTLANNKLMPEFRKLHYSNFVKYLGRLNNIRHKADELDLDVLRNQVQKEDTFYYKDWLVKMMDELEKKLLVVRV
jgi:hypothetical protein